MPPWKKALLVMLLAPKGGILFAPLFLSKFMAGSPFLSLAASEAFVKKIQVSMGIFIGLNFAKFLKRVVVPKSNKGAGIQISASDPSRFGTYMTGYQS